MASPPKLSEGWRVAVSGLLLLISMLLVARALPEGVRADLSFIMWSSAAH